MTKLQNLKLKYKDKYKEDVIIDLYKLMLENDRYFKIDKLTLITIISAIGSFMIILGIMIMIIQVFIQ